MRIRSIKPEFYRSADVTNLRVEDRLLFIALWSYVDDNGVGRDEEPAIIGDLFATDMFRSPRETVARVSGGLAHLSDKGLIVRYTVAERPFLFITNWEKHQRIDRPANPRYPRPDGESVILATPSRDLRDTPATGTEEQGSRGTEKKDVHPPSADEFERFWNLYPRKQGKQAALKAFVKARKTTSLEVIMAGLNRYVLATVSAEKQFVKMAGPWLNDGRWEDEPVATGTPDLSRAYETTSPAVWRAPECELHPGYPLPCDRCKEDAA